MARKPKTSDVSKKQLSDVQQAYRKERRRIQRQIRRMENRAYDVPSLLPDMPKRITQASVNRLKKISTEYLYKHSRYIDIDTGEILTGEQGRKKERKEAALRAAATRRELKKELVTPPSQPITPPPEPDYVMFDKQILTVFTMEMTEIFGRNEKLFNYITRWYNMSLEKYGAEEMAEALEKAKSEGLFPGWEAVSDSEILVGKLEAITNLMAINSESREELFEKLKALEDWTEGD